MTILEAITQTRNVKPNQYDDNLLVRWLSEIEGLIYHEYIVWHLPKEEPKMVPEEELETDVEQPVDPEPEFPRMYDPETDMDTVLFVPDPYSSVYVQFLCAQIDYYNGEMNRYNNSMVMYNVALKAFIDYYNRNHMPNQDNYIRT